MHAMCLEAAASVGSDDLCVKTAAFPSSPSAHQQSAGRL